MQFGEISGSLTNLNDGTSYLIAGTNVTIVSESWGAVTISSTGGSGSPANPFESVQYNDAGSFGGSANFTYNQTNGQLYLTGSLSQGDNTLALGDYSHSEGGTSIGEVDINTTAEGNYSHAEGLGTWAYGQGSHTEGRETYAEGDSSHAEGYGTSTYDVGAHAEGLNCYAYAQYSHAEGGNTTTTGLYSHAEGYGTYAIGDYSHAEGFGSEALASYSHAEGYSTSATEEGAFAIGYETVALGSYSFTQGLRTIASGSYQTVIGKYNARNNDTSLFVVGNGTSNSVRYDALRVEPGSGGYAVMEVTGSVVVKQHYAGEMESITSAGYISNTLHLTYITSATGAYAVGLANGVRLGQLKYIVAGTITGGAGGDVTLTPDTGLGWTSMSFSSYESATLIWMGAGWAILSVYNASVT